ncbi:hypothetical protein SERLA73DRAFT_138954 [Serpula lacrymans var. lacrymans S7.3]|uniref:Uncharacterized protein n=1 Tax=Serpula lacrymans var. lacrymans (strain S7.3) TaxID=936435 RepID=F8Q005_SERL3|nr:hypothetical protein SERLA73DRAFT_138954 [Serpula lacrymans var. lacrymans S7.3]
MNYDRDTDPGRYAVRSSFSASNAYSLPPKTERSRSSGAISRYVHDHRDLSLEKDKTGLYDLEGQLRSMESRRANGDRRRKPRNFETEFLHGKKD